MSNDYFNIKNKIFYEHPLCDLVEPLDFYREVFPKGSFEEEGRQDQKRANGIL